MSLKFMQKYLGGNLIIPPLCDIECLNRAVGLWQDENGRAFDLCRNHSIELQAGRNSCRRLVPVNQPSASGLELPARKIHRARHEEMSGFNPIRRAPIKPKAKAHRESAPWRAERIRLNAKEMAALRHAVFCRASARCEKCETNAGWYDGHLHHVIKRSQGGSDSEENTLWLCISCHMIEHGR